MSYANDHKKRSKENRKDEIREVIYQKYFDIMGILLYKQDYQQVKKSENKSNYLYYLNRLIMYEIPLI